MKPLYMVLAAILAASCAATSTGPKNWEPRLFVADAVRQDIHIESVREEWLEGDTLQVLVSGRAISDPGANLRYRAIWFNSAGMPIDTVLSSWNRAELAFRRPFELKMTGPAQEGVGYRVEIEKYK